MKWIELGALCLLFLIWNWWFQMISALFSKSTNFLTLLVKMKLPKCIFNDHSIVWFCCPLGYITPLHDSAALLGCEIQSHYSVVRFNRTIRLHHLIVRFSRNSLLERRLFQANTFEYFGLSMHMPFERRSEEEPGHPDQRKAHFVRTNSGGATCRLCHAERAHFRNRENKSKSDAKRRAVVPRATGTNRWQHSALLLSCLVENFSESKV